MAQGPIQRDWLLQASAALRGALDAGAYSSADHLLAAIEAACEQGNGNDVAAGALADAYLLLDRMNAPTPDRPT